MSGIIPSGIVTVAIHNNDSTHDIPQLLRFPTRVQITQVGFSITNSPFTDNLYHEGDFTVFLDVVKFRGAGGAYPSSHSIALFAPADRPKIFFPGDHSTKSMISTLATPIERGTWDVLHGGAPYTGDVAQMDTDEWLELSIDGDNDGWYDGNGTLLVTIAYEGATNND